MLDSAAYLLAREVAERLEAGYPNLAGSFRRYVTLMDEDGHNKFETDFLERSLTQKARAWGNRITLVSEFRQTPCPVVCIFKSRGGNHARTSRQDNHVWRTRT